jgi:hypothetical protein
MVPNFQTGGVTVVITLIVKYQLLIIMHLVVALDIRTCGANELSVGQPLRICCLQ